jgi:3-hydroxymyristoyl/3-hydroxydecanoyl-(acyl carrier protein) dehydratase
MDAHFRAFSFVDRITSVQDGRRIRGRYTIPAEADGFPLALVGEAVGQLAAWAAMAAVNFDHRPVAGLAGSIELLLEPRAGQALELAADLEHVDSESVEYRGTAHLGGRPVIRLQDCVGPMVPLVEFDDPLALKERFEQLCRTEVNPGAFPELPRLTLERTSGEPGRCLSATFQVPSEAPLFADHFPRRPVFPGSLLMHLKLQLSTTLAREIAPPAEGRWVAGTILDMKLRSFIAPGATLRLEAKLKQRSHDSIRLYLETRSDKEIIATANLVLKVEEVI